MVTLPLLWIVHDLMYRLQVLSRRNEPKRPSKRLDKKPCERSLKTCSSLSVRMTTLPKMIKSSPSVKTWRSTSSERKIGNDCIYIFPSEVVMGTESTIHLVRHVLNEVLKILQRRIKGLLMRIY